MPEVFVANLIKELGKKEVEKLRARIHNVDPVKDWKAIEEKFDAFKCQIGAN